MSRDEDIRTVTLSDVSSSACSNHSIINGAVYRNKPKKTNLANSTKLQNSLKKGKISAQPHTLMHCYDSNTIRFRNGVSVTEMHNICIIYASGCAEIFPKRKKNHSEEELLSQCRDIVCGYIESDETSSHGSCLCKVAGGSDLHRN